MWKDLKKGDKIYVGTPVYADYEFSGYTIVERKVLQGINKDGYFKFSYSDDLISNKIRAARVPSELMSTDLPIHGDFGILFVALDLDSATKLGLDLINNRIVEQKEAINSLNRNIENLERCKKRLEGGNEDE